MTKRLLTTLATAAPVPYGHQPPVPDLQTANVTACSLLVKIVLLMTVITGTGQLIAIDGPLTNDTITYAYDEWNRVASSNVAGSIRSQTYDGLGRVIIRSNALGSFTNSYIGATARLSGVAMPGGMQAILNWTAVSQDARLASIKYQRSDTSRISEQTYTHVGDGRIVSWKQQSDNLTANTWSYGYDGLDQLVSATKKQGSSFIQSQGWSYDQVGNRRSAQFLTSTSGSVSSGTFNIVNQLLTTGPGGKLRVTGSLDEAGTVKINGNDTPVAADKSFSQLIDVLPGATNFTVEATDLKGNKRTDHYRVDTTSGTANRSLSYDANGNCISDGIFTYGWDAANRLVQMVNGTARTVMTYDGFGQRTRIQEFTGNTQTKDRRFLWSGGELLEERDGGGNALKRYFAQGVQIVSTTPVAYFYMTDHLGSVREVVNSAGVVQARYDYDAWGNRTKISGTFDADVGYTGHVHHQPSGLILTWFRAYDPGIGRWLSRDPIGESGGINLYGYVENSPINAVDPFGLSLADYMERQRQAVNYNSSDPNRACGGSGMDGGAGYGTAMLTGLVAAVAWAAADAINPVALFGRAASAAIHHVAAANRGGGFIDPATIRFSQDSIKGTFKAGGSVDDLAAGLKAGTIKPGDIPAIRLVDKDGALFSLDNRRLQAFQQAGVPIPYRMATPQEVAAEAFKFSTGNGGTSIRVRGK